jgi:D-amino peptidase
MMQELDSSFDAAMMVGYHSYSGSGDNPLAHTLDDTIAFIKINGEYASEFLINAYTAALVDVPVVFVSGDEGLCNHIKQINENITTLAVKKGSGSSTTSIHPALAAKLTTENVQSALKGDLSKCKLTLPKSFKVEISYVNHYNAYKASFYPGMKQISPTNVVFETNDYFQVLCAFSFVI